MKRPAESTGFILYETIMAMALTMALILGITQLLTIVAQQRRQACQYAVAIQEAGNQMEELVARNWDEITMDLLSTMTLSKTSSDSLPDAKLDVDVMDEEDGVRRIRVRIDWCSAPGQRSGPVCLVGWKYRAQESNP